MKELVQYVTRSLVSHPEAVMVSVREQDGKHLVSLQVHPDDAGNVIGRKRRTLWAIRVLLETLAQRRGAEFDLEFVEPDPTTGGSEPAAED